MKEYRKEKRKERKRKAKGEVSDEEEAVDPEMAALMGFTGFGSQKKKKS